MKNFIICIIFIGVFCTSTTIKAQEEAGTTSSVGSNLRAFELGDNILSAGVGVGGTFGAYKTTSQTPALSIAYERGMWELGEGVLGLGGYIGYKAYTNRFTDFSVTYEQKWSYTIIGASLAYHHDIFNNAKIDPYAGLLLAMRFLKYTDNYHHLTGVKPKYNNSDLTFSVYLGLRYYVSPNIGIFGQLGYGISYFTLGVNFRL
jgi:hypothetical protein